MSSSTANNGAIEPEPKRRRLLDAGGPIEDDETARQKMRDARVYDDGEIAGFDPDCVSKTRQLHGGFFEGDDEVSPMGYFAWKGDLPMMRWLYVNGADTRDVDVARYFPMYLAAGVEACKWLFEHGAAKDIKRRAPENKSWLGENRSAYPNGRSPFAYSFGIGTKKSRDKSRWHILNGAFCKDDDSGELDFDIMKQNLGQKDTFDFGRDLEKGRKALLEWATDLHRARTSFLLFLSGARSGPKPKHTYSTRRTVSPLQLLGGKPGILELISDYAAIVCGREARIVRQLTEMLPKVIVELDADADSSSDESSSGESSSDESSSGESSSGESSSGE